jgi:hypothetical protein
MSVANDVMYVQWQTTNLCEHVRVRLYAVSRFFDKSDQHLVEKCVDVVWIELILQTKRLQIPSSSFVADVADVAFEWCTHLLSSCCKFTTFMTQNKPMPLPSAPSSI